MGNYRFRLSDMMPNSWFYKLRDMGRATRAQTTIQHSSSSSKRILHHHHHPKITTRQSNSNPNPNRNPNPPSSTQQQVYLPNRPSYYFSSRGDHQTTTSPAHPKASDTHFPISPPRKSTQKPRKKPIKPPPKPIHSSVSNSTSSASATDIVFDVLKPQSPAKYFDDALSACHLPPILTKPAKKEAAERAELESKHVRLHRIKVRPSSSPKIEVKRVKACRNRKMANSKRLGESFVLVKKSADPQRDFRESMVEMIIENDIRDSKDLEELLACYLSLNSDEYHGLIVKVFEEIWVDLAEWCFYG